MSEVVLHAPTPPKVEAIRRKVLALKWRPWRVLLHDLATLHVQVTEELERVINTQHDAIISKWKEVARSWNSSSSKVFAYLRNPSPQKSVAILHQGEVRSDPLRVQDALFSYWAELENWTGFQLRACLETLDDKYSFLLPHHAYQAYVQPSDLIDVAKSTRASSPGLDGWTHKEVAILPMHAWLDLMMVCLWCPESFFDSLTSVYKRVPISKVDSGVPTPDQIRPIDLFSVILRIQATALVRALKPWVMRIEYPAQHALSGGAVLACSRTAWTTECAEVGLTQIWGLSRLCEDV